MSEELDELNQIKENFKPDSFNGHWLYSSQIEWLIEQAEKALRYEKALEEIEEVRCFDSCCDAYDIANKALNKVG